MSETRRTLAEGYRYDVLGDGLCIVRRSAERWWPVNLAPEECFAQAILASKGNGFADDILLMDRCIAHWLRMRNDQKCGDLPIAEHCPACAKYLTGFCRGCPISEFAGDTNCFHTPYANARKAWYVIPLNSSAWQSAADAEIAFLREVREWLVAGKPERKRAGDARPRVMTPACAGAPSPPAIAKAKMIVRWLCPACGMERQNDLPDALALPRTLTCPGCRHESTLTQRFGVTS